MTIELLHKKFIECSQEISTDTRTISFGSMFFAWKGERNDGNNYVKIALDKGARYVVCDNPDALVDHRCILVENTLKTLQNLARYHRIQFDVPVIAIGGSNGKTTTKELLANIVKQQKDTVASFGSMNNHTGVPLTLLRISATTDFVIIEMGANHIGEIAELCTIACPTHGLVTNIGRDHIGFFGSTDAILTANLELYNYLKKHQGFVFINKNDNNLSPHASNIHHLFYGLGLESENGMSSLETVPHISGKWKHYKITTHLTGEYNLENIIAAIAVAKYFAVQDKFIISGIENYIPSNNRSEILSTLKENIIIKDFYNANRTSMELAIDNLLHISLKYPDLGSIAILGDMLELGEYSSTEHQAVIDYAETRNFDEIILIGPLFSKTNFKKATGYENVDAAIAKFSDQIFQKKVILLKASNGTNLGKLFNRVNW
jgi:UDP-N-acetylmuramoyl-tripeptide--D-alanyl-D-alanine ligase